MTLLTMALVLTSQIATALTLTREQALQSAERMHLIATLNIACVSLEGDAFGVVYRSRNLPKPEVLFVMDSVESFGPNSPILTRLPGPLDIALPKDISEVPEAFKLPKTDGSNVQLARTTATFGSLRNLQCLYTLTPGTWRAVYFVKTGVLRLE